MITPQAIVVEVVVEDEEEVVVVVGYAEQPGFVSVHARGELDSEKSSGVGCVTCAGCRHLAAGY